MTGPRRRSLSDISINDLRSRIKSLKRANLLTLSDEAAALRIGRIIDQYHFHIKPLHLTGIYRARANKPGEVFSLASQLWHPPADKVLRPSRLNGLRQVRFYASNMPNTALAELRPQPGNVFTVLLPMTRSRKLEKLDVAFIGLERSRAPEVQHFSANDMFRHAPYFRDQLGLTNYKKWLLIDDYLSEIFATPVPEGEEYRYKPTIALANLLFRAPLDAITYPSVATNDHGINICMLPDKADRFFAPAEAWMIRLQEHALHPKTGEQLQRIEFLNRSHEIGPDGAIIWRSPGEGINPEEIMRFARGRIKSLDQWPLVIKPLSSLS